MSKSKPKKKELPAHRVGAPSAFSITINTNQTEKSLQKQGIDPKIFMKRFRDALTYIRKNAVKFLKKDFDGTQRPTVKAGFFELEYGPNKHLLHAHGKLAFSSYCQINVPVLKSFINKALVIETKEVDGTKKRGGTKGAIVWVKFLANYEDNLERYSKKTQVKKI